MNNSGRELADRGTEKMAGREFKGNRRIVMKKLKKLEQLSKLNLQVLSIL